MDICAIPDIFGRVLVHHVNDIRMTYEDWSTWGNG